VSRKWRNWYQNKVDEEINRVGSRDKVKHNERSDYLRYDTYTYVYITKSRGPRTEP